MSLILLGLTERLWNLKLIESNHSRDKSLQTKRQFFFKLLYIQDNRPAITIIATNLENHRCFDLIFNYTSFYLKNKTINYFVATAMVLFYIQSYHWANTVFQKLDSKTDDIYTTWCWELKQEQPAMKTPSKSAISRYVAVYFYFSIFDLIWLKKVFIEIYSQAEVRSIQFNATKIW